MSEQPRRRWTAEEKLQILKEARQTATTVSEVCRRHGIAVGQFYAWEKMARQGALEALRKQQPGRKKPDLQVQYQAELERLRAAVTELSLDNLQLKRGLYP